MKFKVRLEWEPRYLWVGVFWDVEVDRRDVHVCIVPTLAIHVWWFTNSS